MAIYRIIIGLTSTVPQFVRFCNPTSDVVHNWQPGFECVVACSPLQYAQFFNMPNWMTFLPVVPQFYLFSRLSWLLPKKLQMGREQARLELVGKTSNSNLGLGQSDILYSIPTK
jgi:hypothetical protein